MTLRSTPAHVTSSLRRRAWLPGLLVVAVSIIPVAGVFTLSRIFFLRDLTITFRSRYLFLRHAVASGSFPLWDPYPANGQATVNDALYQLFHLPTLLIRLVLPDPVAFNIWVAAPIPIAAFGMYLFLRRHLGQAASAFGAIAYAVSGPIVSTTNFPNLSWSVAAVPYVFWALDRVFERRSPASVGVLALVVSCQALAGEPVTLVTTLAIAAAYAVVTRRRWRDLRGVSLVAAGMVAGLLLSAVQYVPMVLAGRESLRSTMTGADFWAFHPLALFELLVPQFFGNYFQSNLRELAWMTALNSGRDPFYYTMYIGVPIVLLAGVAMSSGRGGTRFWTVVIVACAIAALGSYTPIYPLVQKLLPPLRTFRFPVKYLSLASLGIATLAATTLQSLLDGQPSQRGVRVVLVVSTAAAVITYVAIAWLLIAPTLPIHGFYRLAVWAKVPAPIQGAQFLLFRARPLLTALLLKVIAAAFLLAIAASRRREQRTALLVLSIVAVVDLLASNRSVNPTLEASTLADPNWLRYVPRDMHERVYVGGRLEGFVDTFDVDAPRYASYRDDIFTGMEQRHLVVQELIFNPSGSRVRESMSYDLPLLWPLDFARTLERFKVASREERLRYLTRAGTRFVILPTPPSPGAVPLVRLNGVDQMQLYDYYPNARRTYVVPDAFIGPDLNWQIEGLFQPRFDPSQGVLVSERPPPPSGKPGPPVAASATFLEDGINRVVVRAGAPADGYLALLDSYNPDWRVDVDGMPATLMRANGLFRAVHLVPGDHVVTFTYHPSRMYLGALISAVTAVALVVWAVVDRRRRTNVPVEHG